MSDDQDKQKKCYTKIVKYALNLLSEIKKEKYRVRNFNKQQAEMLLQMLSTMPAWSERRKGRAYEQRF